MIKLLVLALQVFSALSGAQADYWDDYDIVIEELQDIVLQAQTLSYDQQRDISFHIVAYAGNATNDGQATVKTSADSLTRQLDNLLVLAEALGKQECLEDRQEELQTIADDVAYEIFDCIKWLEIGARSTIINISAYIGLAQETVTLYRIRQEQCPRSSGDEECILIIIGEMQVAKDYLPSMILDETLRVILLMKTYEESMLLCSESRIGLIYTEGNRVVFEVENCITGSGAKLDEIEDKSGKLGEATRKKDKS